MHINIGTQSLATILDPEILIIQIIFTLFWVVAFALHFKTYYRLRNVSIFSPVEYYRFNMAIVGMIQAFILILYWIIHEGRFQSNPFFYNLMLLKMKFDKNEKQLEGIGITILIIILMSSLHFSYSGLLWVSRFICLYLLLIKFCIVIMQFV